MRAIPAFGFLFLLVSLVVWAGCSHRRDSHRLGEEVPAAAAETAAPVGPAGEQAPAWTAEDLEFFLHGSLGTEFLPERTLRAMMGANPELFGGGDLAAFGLIPDGDLPIGVTRREVAHLGGLPSIGINCASCHVARVAPSSGGAEVRVLGLTAPFDTEAFFGAIAVSMARTREPWHMRHLLLHHLDDEALESPLKAAWDRQAEAIGAALAEDPAAASGAAPGTLLPLAADELRLDAGALAPEADLVPRVRAFRKLFHNVRVALHLPDPLPPEAPPASGPGRNDPWGLLSLSLLGVDQPYAPVKFGSVWNMEGRPWVHCDGNTGSPLARNILAALGLGAPLQGDQAALDLPAIRRHTRLTEMLRAPRWAWGVDDAAAARGATVYAKSCASCHDGPENDRRLYAPEEVGTDPARARAFDAAAAQRFNDFFARLKAPGYAPPAKPTLRATGKYWAHDLAGVWARAPYLHNGSVRTLRELLTPSARAATFRRGSATYDPAALGFVDEGPYVLDTARPGNSNRGHEYGAELSEAEKGDLMEFLKTK